MPFLTKQEVYDRFKMLSRNSSHFVWLLADLRYFETSLGWVFGFSVHGDVTLFALEPLIPGAPTEYNDKHQNDFNEAWKELSQAIEIKIAAFVSIYGSFLKILRTHGFQTVKVGQEPWVALSDCIPTGNAGKGVRAARNQAIRGGLQVEEWNYKDIQSDDQKRNVIKKILSGWKHERIIDLSGFMNSVDPFAFMKSRRYFIAKSENGKVWAYLVATEIPGIRSYFLEDLFMEHGAPRGTGELLTLEALVSLNNSGIQYASLGVVSVTSVETESARDLPKPIEWVLLKLPKILMSFYNFDGLEIFRKRFKPQKWENIHLAVKNYTVSEVSDTRAWFKVLYSLLKAFSPKVQISGKWLISFLINPIKKYPLTFSVGASSFLLFAWINDFGVLPQWALSQYGFTGEAPFSEWIFRSIISDFLYFSPEHFYIWGSIYFLIIAWSEKTHKKMFLIPFFLCSIILDDFVNYLLIIRPFDYIHPKIFKNLIAFKDVGGSLVMVTLVGLQICQFKKNREIVFTVIGLAIVFGFVFSSAKFNILVLNLNHFLFLCIGYLCGKLKFEYERHRSRMMSKNPPPVSRTVSPVFENKKLLTYSESGKKAA